MEPILQKETHIYDVFISYSRKDKEFASRLEKALENYKPSKDLKVPQRNLKIFRDEEDITGVEYNQAIETNLKNSKKLIVICSPDARKSKYVNDEIRRFAEIHGSKNNIIPILISGIPNNEAMPGQEEEMAFPEALCEGRKVPLARIYLGFDLRKDKVDRGGFSGSWYTILADIYDISRSEIEQRDKKKQARRRRITIGIVSGVIVALSAALVLTLISRQEAIEQRKIAQEKKQEAEKAAVKERKAKKAEKEQREKAEESDKVAKIQRDEAIRQRKVAIEQKNIAISRELAASAMSLLKVDLELSVLLSMEAVKFSPTTQAENALRQSLQNSHALAVMHGHTGIVTSASFSPNGKYVVTASYDKTARIWDATSRKSLKVLRGHTDSVENAVFSPDGQYLVTASHDGTARIWDVATGESLKVLRGHTDIVRGAVFSPDGKSVVTASWDKTARIWEAATGQSMSELRGHTDIVQGAVFSPDGKYVVTASWDNTYRAWEAATGQSVAELRGNIDNVSSVFSPDGKYVVAGSEDGTALIWDVATGESLKELRGHSRLVSTSVFSPDGKYVVTGSEDGTARIWDVDTGESLKELRGHTDWVKSAPSAQMESMC